MPHGAPEILEADLAPLALLLADVGIADPSRLTWLDPPAPAAYAQARELLGALGGIDAYGSITPHGKRLASLPMHPRLAHMVLSASTELRPLACDIAALLGERDLMRGDAGPPDADLRLRLEAIRSRDARDVHHGMTVDRDAVRRVREQSREWRERLSSSAIRGRSSGTARADGLEPHRASDDIAHAGALLAMAYPDRIGQQRSPIDSTRSTGGSSPRPGETRGARFLLRNGRGAILAGPQSLGTEPYLAIAELDDQRPESRIFLAAPLALEDLESQFGSEIQIVEVIAWDPTTKSVIARRRRILGSIVLADAPLRDVDPKRIADALLEGVRAEGIAGLPWSEGARRLRERMAFMARQDPTWPDVSDEALRTTLDAWLAPHIAGLRRLTDIDRVDLAGALASRLDWKQRALLDEVAPTHLAVPSGSRVAIDYSDPGAPVLAVRLQEMFGCSETPRIAGGRVPLTIHLLSPAQRPVQVTRDLAGFWRTTYFDVRKDLRGRYPKHHWPDDPIAAVPTSRTKRRT